MSMLPDVDESGYDTWQDQLSQEDAQRRIQGMGFTMQANDRMGDLQRIGAWAAAPTPEPAPVPEPQPAPVAEPQPEVVSAAPAPTSVVSASRGPAANPQSSAIESAPASPASASGDWVSSAFDAAVSAGADAGTFIGNLGSESGDRMLDAMNAVIAAGGDVDRFIQGMRPGGPVASPVKPTGPSVGSGPLQDYARQAAQRAGIDPDIFVRQIQQESGFNPAARSPAGASGVAQIVPRYHPGVDTTDPYASLDYAANLMRSNLGKYGGDYARALAAYNAGAGAVDRFGGVPPFEETQRYVSTILGNERPSASSATPSEGLARVGAAQAASVRDISQFGNPQLTNDEAYAACGPAAAVRFAQRFGRNPTLREAVDLAKTVGWNESQGMAGLSSEKALMDKIGVPTKLVSGADWGTFANEARTGNPVTISTRGHYFTADGWDPQTNRFHVGRSGLDLKGGSEWMTPEQMEAIMGPVQGGLLADNPQVASPSLADQDSNPIGWLDRARQSMADSLSTPKTTDAPESVISPERSSVFSNISSVFGEPTQQAASAEPARPLDLAGVQAQVEPEPQPQPEPASPIDRLKSAFGDFIDSLSGGNQPPQPITRAEDLAQQQAVSPIPAPGRGYDPSSMRAVTESPQEGIPLRQDVRDLGLAPQSTLGDAFETARQTSRAALVSPEGDLQLPPDEAMKPIVGAISRGVPGLNLLPEETVFQAGKALAPSAKGPLLLSDREVLERASPEQLARARNRLAQINGTTYEPTDTEIADALRVPMLGEAIAMAEGGAGGTGRTGEPAKKAAEAIQQIEEAGRSRGIDWRQLGEWRRDIRSQAGWQEPPPPSQGAPYSEWEQFYRNEGKWAPPPETKEGNLLDKTVAVGVNGMLSATGSFFTNLFGLTENLKRPIVTATTSAVELATGNPSMAKRELSAAGADLQAQGAAFGDAFADLWTTFKTGRRPSQVQANRDVRTEAFPDEWGMFWTPNLRAMGGVDEFNRGLANAAGQGSKVAQLMHDHPNLSQTEILDRFRNEIMDAGIAAGKEATYEAGGTPIGSGLAKARGKFTDPDATPSERFWGGIAQILAPFSSIPDVLLTRGIGRLPGVNTVRTVGESAYYAAQGDMRAAKRAAASGFLADAVNLAVLNQVVAGNITGNGPSDKDKKAALMAATDENGNHTWAPNSVRVGPWWVSYSSLGPVAVQMGFVANAYEQYLESGKKPSPDLMEATLMATGETIADAWYLQQVARVFNAMKQGGLDKGGEELGASVAGRYTALQASGLVNEIRQMTDPTIRDPQNLMDRLLNRYPVLDQLVPPDIERTTGEPRREERGIPNVFIRATGPQSRPNEAARVLAEHNMGIPEAPEEITIGSGRNAITFELKEGDERRRYEEAAGREIEKNVLELKRDPEWQRGTPDERRDILQKVVAASRKLAALDVAETIADDEIDRRVEAKRIREERQAQPGVVLPGVNR